MRVCRFPRDKKRKCTGGSFRTSLVPVELKNLELVVHAVQTHAGVVVKEHFLPARVPNESVVAVVCVYPLRAMLAFYV